MSFLTARELKGIRGESPTFEDFLQNIGNNLIAKYLARTGKNLPDGKLEAFLNALIEDGTIRKLYE